MTWIDWDAIHAVYNFWIIVGVFVLPLVALVVSVLVIFALIATLIDK